RNRRIQIGAGPWVLDWHRAQRPSSAGRHIRQADAFSLISCTSRTTYRKSKSGKQRTGGRRGRNGGHTGRGPRQQPARRSGGARGEERGAAWRGDAAATGA